MPFCPIPFSQELLKEFEESNGTPHLVTSTPRKMQVQAQTQTQTQDTTEQETTDQTVMCEGDEPVEEKKEKGCGLSSVKQMSRKAASVMSVENPHNIDRHARILFPMAFLLINVFYWLYYLLF